MCFWSLTPFAGLRGKQMTSINITNTCIFCTTIETPN
uniref:Uncharacterized protein n=1 Tax=Rhizophora mucronata TaxID=61149 RepID=A0A2P2M6B8_RHIMU